MKTTSTTPRVNTLPSRSASPTTGSSTQRRSGSAAPHHTVGGRAEGVIPPQDNSEPGIRRTLGGVATGSTLFGLSVGTGVGFVTGSSSMGAIFGAAAATTFGAAGGVIGRVLDVEAHQRAKEMANVEDLEANRGLSEGKEATRSGKENPIRQNEMEMTKKTEEANFLATEPPIQAPPPAYTEASSSEQPTVRRQHSSTLPPAIQSNVRATQSHTEAVPPGYTQSPPLSTNSARTQGLSEVSLNAAEQRELERYRYQNAMTDLENLPAVPSDLPASRQEASARPSESASRTTKQLEEPQS